jgi:purine catabolism regulator
MPPTLRSLVENEPLGLRVLAAADGLDRPIQWAHVSELEDPTPFLEGGELLLTTGLHLNRRRGAMRSYVERLAAAGVVGLGFGVGVPYPKVPEGLVAAAEDLGLPVLEVPLETPFIVLSKAVSRALAAEEYDAVARAYRAQQELTRGALGAEGLAGLVRVLARQLDAWVLHLDASGGVVHAAPRNAARHAKDLGPEVERLRAAGTVASAGTAIAGVEVGIQSLGAGRRLRGFLAIGRATALRPAERHVVNGAASLLTLGLEQIGALAGAEQHLRTGLLHLMLRGELVAVRQPAKDLWGGLPREPVRLVVAAGDVSSRASLADVLDSVATRMRERAFHAPEGDRLIMLLAEEGQVQTRVLAAAEQFPALRLGLSEPADLEHLGRALRQAEQALTVGLRAQARVTRFAELGGSGLLPLLPADAARAFAESLLRPLLRHDENGRGDLVRSLRAWLGHHGQWDPAAAHLNVHRHTLRHRMRRVEEILGRSLDSPSVRMELWAALEILHEDLADGSTT